MFGKLAKLLLAFFIIWCLVIIAVPKFNDKIESVVEPIFEKFLGPHHSDSSEETNSQTTGINSTIFSDLYI